MFANRYTALIDACSLVSVWRRNLLLSLAEAEFFRIRWSAEILAETERALVKLHNKRSASDAELRAGRAIENMRRAFPEASTEELLPALSLSIPDQGDAHVILAAVQTQAQTIVTENLKDFPSDKLAPLNMEARTADDFIADTIALDEGKAVSVIHTLRQRLNRPQFDSDQLLKELETHGLLETASILAPHRDSI